MEGMQITVEDIIGSTGLELKVDPGVPWVYAGFAGDPARSSCNAHCLCFSPCFEHEISTTSSCAYCTGCGLYAVQTVSDGMLKAVAHVHAGLMITTIVSYLSHSQIWALQDGGWLHIGGKTNRATITFANEMDDMLNEVPEYLPELVQAVGSGDSEQDHIAQSAAEGGGESQNGNEAPPSSAVEERETAQSRSG